jgi:glycyl-tRNA synthetase beta chain
VEIGCEEIPARFLTKAQTGFGATLEAALRQARLLPEAAEGSVETYSTPRRLVAHVRRLLARQPDQVQQVLGPPVKVAFDAAGKPTRAASSFAEKHGVSVKQLHRVTAPKGEYLALEKTLRGQRAKDLLPEILTDAIAGLDFPKSMYWVAKAGPRFVRPIRWLLALLGEGKAARVVKFQFAGIKSSRFTFGHRVVGKGGFKVEGFNDYANKLRQKYVELDPQQRRNRLIARCEVLLEDRLRLIEDKELEDWIINSTEWPSPILGSFDERFLHHLPSEILITVMRDHQKYFAVQDRQGKLQPQFVAVLNLDSDEAGWIRAGHERVLSARFSDAEFFWQADQKISLDDRRERLARVTYEAELGSYAEKVRRMAALAKELVAALGGAGKLTAEEAAHALRAVELAKCDLTTQMVQEFPELQGVVGGLYAQAQGEPAGVAEAIYDHYRPQGMEDRCPRSVAGAVVSLADKIDTLVGGFVVGHEPSGSSDPFGLRRCGNGIIKVLVEMSLPISLKKIVLKSLNSSDTHLAMASADGLKAVLGFLEERLRYYLETILAFRYDTVRAVLAAGWDAPVEAVQRAKALEAMRGSEDFEALAVAAKRIKNILTKSATAADWQPGEVDRERLQEEEERTLYARYLAVAAEAEQLVAQGEYRPALEAIAGLRPVVDHFFDKVLVMAEDPGLRQNRLRLLGKLDELFSSIAQFAEIVSAPANVGASTSPGQ